MQQHPPPPQYQLLRNNPTAPYALEPPSSAANYVLLQRLAWKAALLAALVAALVLTYQSCVPCVMGVALLALLTIHCLPGASVVFVACVCVLLYHAVDVKSASIRVQIPLNDIVRVPTYAQLQDDFRNYVHVDASAASQPPPQPLQPTPQQAQEEEPPPVHTLLLSRAR